jgi:hypothetical protein
MKKISLIVLFFVCSNIVSAQQIITICSEKNGCQFAKVNVSKAQIDQILMKSGFLANQKATVILNLMGCKSTIEKKLSAQDLHQQFGGKGSISEVKNFDLKKYLIDNSCFGKCNSPSIPNAGKQANQKIGISGSFTFNRKFKYSIDSPEGNFTSDFYLNLQNGYALMDNQAMKKMAGEPFEGEVNQIMTATSDYYQYIKSLEGNFSMKMGGKQNNLLDNSKKVSADFFKNFRKTGVKRLIYGTEDSEEYAGISEGQKMSVWLSCSDRIAVDKKITYALTGFFGLGYVVNPTGQTFLITAIEGSDVAIKLLGIENTNISFFGNIYKPMGEMMAIALGEMQQELNTNLNNENEYETQVNLEMLRASRQFAQSSDAQDLPSTTLVGSELFNANFYNYIIDGFQQSIEENQNAIADLDKNTTDYKKRIAQLNCLKNCATTEKARFEKIKAQHLQLLSQYKNDEEKRNEKVSAFMITNSQPNPCNCN